MTSEELKIQIEKINKQTIDDRNISLLHIREDGSRRRVHNDFEITYKTIHDINLKDYMDIDETIEALYNFKGECKEMEEDFPNSIIQPYEEADNDYGDEEPYVVGFGFKMLDCEITDREVKRVQNRRLRNFLQKKLDGKNIPSCEIIELFLNEKIDWETLKTITNTNCKV